MKYSLKTIEILFFIIACLVGTLSHFVYNWSGQNSVVGLFFPVNESTWEHLKLIFFPIFLTTILEYFLFNQKYHNLICIKLLSSLIGMAVTIVLFYTYTGIYGKNSDVMNILIYFISMAAAFRFSYRTLQQKNTCCLSGRTSYFLFVLMTLLFFIFTIFPPKIGLFLSPI